MRLTDLLPSLLPRNRTLQMAADGVMEDNQVRQAMPIDVARGAQDVLAISCPDPTAEDLACDSHRAMGLKLSRQEDWDRIAETISRFDATRTKTGGGMPVAELLAYGARADVVSAAEHALLHGDPDSEVPLIAGIDALETVLAERPDCCWTAGIVAMTHMDMAWAWRGTGWDADVPQRNRAAFSAHFDRAADILSPYDPVGLDSPMLGTAHAGLSSGQARDAQRLALSFERLIDLDPRNARAMRSFGLQMLPRWHGDHEALELAARRNAGRTYDVWGAGGYTWVMFDAIAADSEACGRLDYDFFAEGLENILKATNDQYIVNLLAAYCANTMRLKPEIDDASADMRARIAENARWIVRDFMHELHPMLWAHAARGFDNAIRVRCARRFAQSGLVDAHRALADMFQSEILSGKRIEFTPDGARIKAYSTI